MQRRAADIGLPHIGVGAIDGARLDRLGAAAAGQRRAALGKVGVAVRADVKRHSGGVGRRRCGGVRDSDQEAFVGAV